MANVHRDSPLLFKGIFQHFDSSHQVLLHVLLPFPLSLQKCHLSLETVAQGCKFQKKKYNTHNFATSLGVSASSCDLVSKWTQLQNTTTAAAEKPE